MLKSTMPHPMIGKNEKLTKCFSQLAKEPVTAEEIGGTAYAFGSEVATLRLRKYYHRDPSAAQGYSENRQTFYFSIELS